MNMSAAVGGGKMWVPHDFEEFWKISFSLFITLRSGGMDFVHVILKLLSLQYLIIGREL